MKVEVPIKDEALLFKESWCWSSFRNVVVVGGLFCLWASWRLALSRSFLSLTTPNEVGIVLGRISLAVVGLCKWVLLYC